MAATPIGALIQSSTSKAKQLDISFMVCPNTAIKEDLPFAIIRDSDSEVLARVATLLLARDLFRAIAVANPSDEILLKQGVRIIESSGAKRSAP